MVNLPPAGGLIPIWDESNEGGVFRKLQELTNWGLEVQLSMYREKQKQRGKNAALRGTSADGLGVQDMFPQLHMLPPVRQEVWDPPAGGVRHVQLGELVLAQSIKLTLYFYTSSWYFFVFCGMLLKGQTVISWVSQQHWGTNDSRDRKRQEDRKVEFKTNFSHYYSIRYQFKTKHTFLDQRIYFWLNFNFSWNLSTSWLCLGSWFKNTLHLFCFFPACLSALSSLSPLRFWQDFDNLNNQMSCPCEPALKSGYANSAVKSL